jgi:hypothetical protein
MTQRLMHASPARSISTIAHGIDSREPTQYLIIGAQLCIGAEILILSLSTLFILLLG